MIVGGGGNLRRMSGWWGGIERETKEPTLINDLIRLG